MEIKKRLNLRAQKLYHFVKKHPTAIFGIFFFSFLLLPAGGFCDINSAFGETKSQVQAIVSNRSGLFWIFMAVILGSAVWALYKGSWKGFGMALLIGIVLGNFSDVIDTLLGTKIFENKSQNEQHHSK